MEAISDMGFCQQYPFKVYTFPHFPAESISMVSFLQMIAHFCLGEIERSVRITRLGAKCPIFEGSLPFHNKSEITVKNFQHFGRLRALPLKIHSERN
jgi:hypothetical protein